MILGMANGCFDGLHDGHRYFLKQCLANCDCLMVLVNGDWWVKLHKGGMRPLNAEKQRQRAVRALLRPWDRSYLWDGSQLERIIERYVPDFVFRGWDQADDVNAEIMRFDQLPGYSTTLEIARRA